MQVSAVCTQGRMYVHTGSRTRLRQRAAHLLNNRLRRNESYYTNALLLLAWPNRVVIFVAGKQHSNHSRRLLVRQLPDEKPGGFLSGS